MTKSQQIVNKALMRHFNEFFTFSDIEKTVFKLTDSEEIDNNIVTFIEMELFGKTFSEDEGATEEQTLLYNSTIQYYRGIGPNYFSLNEFNWNHDVLRFNTLYDYNVHCHNFQEESLATDENFEDHKSYVKKDLYNRFSDWARVIIDDEFFYLNLNSININTMWEVEEHIDSWFDKNLPHDYVQGKNHGKKVKGGSLMDYKLDAGGKERWYDAMRAYSYDVMKDINDNCRQFENVVFIIDKSETNDPSKNYIFGDVSVLNNITFENFITDCEKVKATDEDITALNDYVKSAIADTMQKLDEKFIEVQQTVDNSILDFKKKRKIITMDDSLLDL